MAQSLSQRLGRSDDDTPRKLELAAAHRFRDAEILRQSGRSLTAIYLYGYAVEMWIKAAYFRTYFQVNNRPSTDRITGQDRSFASRSRAPQLIGRSIGFHEIDGWARLLVAERAVLAPPYPTALASDIVSRATDVYLNWREYMRYRSCLVHPAEVATVRTQARWFRSNYSDL